ncbi:MAG: hypothetical protein PHX51_05865 [Clostridia bacterium]|nr:hypothetical protein [Clostridia bacterium]
MNKKIIVVIAVAVIVVLGVIISAVLVNGNVVVGVQLRDDIKSLYALNEEIDLNSVILVSKTNNGKSEEIAITKSMLTGFDTSNCGDFVMVFSYKGVELAVDYTVIDKYYHTVYFNTGNGATDFSIEIYNGQKVEVPDVVPEKKPYVFLQWNSNGEPFNFQSPIYADTMLDAFYNVEDYNSIMQLVESVNYLVINIDPDYLFAEGDKDIYLGKLQSCIKDLSSCTYANEAVSTFNELKKGILDCSSYPSKLTAQKDGLLSSEYFLEDRMILLGLYSNAIDQMYHGTADGKAVETLYTETVTSINEIMNMEENIAAADNSREDSFTKIRNAFEDNINSKLYSIQSLADIEVIFNSAMVDATNAIGTHQLASVVSDFMLKLESVQRDKNLQALRDAFDAFDSNDYFDYGYCQIESIYLNAYDKLLHYPGGAPAPETTIQQADYAMRSVPTREQDIKNAEYDKKLKLRELENFYVSIDRTGMKPTQIQEINALYNEGMALIQGAVGTKAVADAYISTIDSINMLIQPK